MKYLTYLGRPALTLFSGGGGRSAVQLVLGTDAVTAGGGGGGSDCPKNKGCGGGGLHSHNLLARQPLSCSLFKKIQYALKSPSSYYSHLICTS